MHFGTNDKIIVTDFDGCCGNWEYAFCVWMEQNGFTQVPNGNNVYSMAERFLISSELAIEKIKEFNKSAAIGFLPAFRDSVHYIKRLHEEHGYVFHCITSLGKDPSASKLRKMNVEKLFGTSAFTYVECLEYHLPKDAALSKYQDTGFFWIEDLLKNAIAGQKLGMRPILFEHGYNTHEVIPDGMIKVTSWKEIYEHIIDS